MTRRRQHLVGALLATALAVAPVASALAGPSGEGRGRDATGRAGHPPGPIVGRSVRNDLSPRLDKIARLFKPPVVRDGREIEVPERAVNNSGAFAPQEPARDPVLQDWKGEQLVPSPEHSFEGLSNEDNFATLGVRPTPPDTNGDIGPDHYVQSVNLIFAVYDRAGNRLLGPLPNNALWAGFGGDCQTRNNGDPIVLYDHLADAGCSASSPRLRPITSASPSRRRPIPRGPGTATTS